MKFLRKSDYRFYDLIFNQNWVRLVNLMKRAEYKKYLKNACGPFHFHYFNYLSMVHLACMMKPPPNVISIMLTTFPSSVIIPDKSERLPLHIACEYGAGKEVIKLLIGQNPASVGMQDIYGKTPLHLACEYKYHSCGEMDELFNILMKASPSSLSLTDSKGFSVLDYAVRQNLKSTLIQKIKWEIKKEIDNLDLSIIEEESYCSEGSNYSNVIIV